MRNLSETLKELRLNAGLTQKELSTKLGLGQSTIVGYERAISEPTIHNLALYAQYFNLTVDEILGLDEKGQGAAAGFAMTKRAELTPEEDELLYYFRALSPYLKQNLLTAAQTMATGSGVKPLHKKA